MEQGRLLPLSAITAKLLNDTSTMITEQDTKQFPEPPAWWATVSRQAVEAAKTGDVGIALIPSTMKAIEDMTTQHGGVTPMVTMSIALKLIVMGWMMAEMYLEQQIEKSAVQ
jgi:hypothetical protein